MNLDEARTLANVNDRAQRLFEDGYRIRSLDSNLHLIRSEHGATYTLDRAEKSCTCPFFEKHGGRYSCKHVLGWKKLHITQKVTIARLSPVCHNDLRHFPFPLNLPRAKRKEPE